MKMLETLLSGPEYVQSAKKAGVYSGILQWIAAYRSGTYAAWPRTGGTDSFFQPQVQQMQSFAYRQPLPQIPQTPVSFQQDPRIPSMNPPRKVIKENMELATTAPPKRNIDTLHEAYAVLGIDDSKPLTHELLRSYYKRAASKAHPDKGGNARLFDEVTRSFMYLQEILNKLIPKGASGDGEDVRFTAPVTKEEALKARSVPLTRIDAERREAGGAIQIEDAPPVSLNPKNLNMTVFNKLFEENRLNDPQNEGYGEWLKSNGMDVNKQLNNDVLRSKFNAEVFNKVFVEQGAGSGKSGSSQLARYQTPDAITLTGGTELGSRPPQFTAPMGSKTKYTDLMYAYGEGSTFSQDVVGVRTDARNLDQMKKERESAPVPLRPEELSAVEAFEKQKQMAEEERRRRLAAQDVDYENQYARLQRRLMIN
jgi:hypothetical protein